jgi:hypothetical protein
MHIFPDPVFLVAALFLRSRALTKRAGTRDIIRSLAFFLIIVQPGSDPNRSAWIWKERIKAGSIRTAI